MKKGTVIDIFVLLLIPSFLLAGVINVFSILTAKLYPPIPYGYFNEDHLILMVILLSTLAIFTYTSALNILSMFPRIKAGVAKLSAYLGSLIVLLTGYSLCFKYVWLETGNSANGVSLSWPIVFGGQLPVAIFIQNFFTDIVVAGVIAFLVSFAIKEAFKYRNLNRIKRIQ